MLNRGSQLLLSCGELQGYTDTGVLSRTSCLRALEVGLGDRYFLKVLLGILPALSSLLKAKDRALERDSLKNKMVALTS